MEAKDVALIITGAVAAGLAGYIIWDKLLNKPGTSVGGTGGIPSFTINVGGGVE